MSGVRQLPLAARLYVACVIVGGVVAVALAMASTVAWVTTLQLAVAYALLDALYARSDAHTARVNVSLGSVCALAAFPLIGVPGAVIVSATAALVPNRRLGLVKRLFNGAQFALAAAAAGLVYVSLGGPTDGLTSGDFPGVLLPLLAADIGHTLVNGLLIVGVISLSEHVSPRDVWFSGMSASAVGVVGYGLFGLLLAVLWGDLGWISAPLLLVPLFTARWAYAQYAEQQTAYDSVVRTLVQAVETKDWYTRGHSERVSTASVLIARGLRMREDRIGTLRYAGLLHDVGKLGVPTTVLQKTGPLTDDEYAAVKQHPVRGLEMVRDIDFLDDAHDAILYHHERLDGGGYPLGLKGDDIPELAKVVAVADAFDAMTSTRSYRGARTVPDAVEELRRNIGTQFEARMVDALVAAVHEVGWQPQPAPAPPVTVTPAMAVVENLRAMSREDRPESMP